MAHGWVVRFALQSVVRTDLLECIRKVDYSDCHGTVKGGNFEISANVCRSFVCLFERKRSKQFFKKAII